MVRNCVKVGYLRKNKKYDNFEEWRKDPINEYVGRYGRVFIHNRDPITKKSVSQRVFNYKSSIWCNPYKVTADRSVKESLLLYVKYLFDTHLIFRIDELRGKNLGCWCETDNCHAQVLTDLLGKCYQILRPILIKPYPPLRNIPGMKNKCIDLTKDYDY